MKRENTLKQATPQFRKFIDILSELSLKEIKIMEFRFVDGMGLEDIGSIFGLTNERVRQIIANAQRKITLKMK